MYGEYLKEYGYTEPIYPDLSKEIEDTVKMIIQNDPTNIPFPKDGNIKSEIRAVESLIGKCNDLCGNPDNDVFACNPYGECQLNFKYADNDDMIYAAKEYRNTIRKWQNFNDDIDGVLRCSSKKKTCEYMRFEDYSKGSAEEEANVLREEERQKEIVRKILKK